MNNFRYEDGEPYSLADVLDVLDHPGNETQRAYQKLEDRALYEFLAKRYEFDPEPDPDGITWESEQPTAEDTEPETEETDVV